MNPAIIKADLSLVQGKMIREDIVEFNGPELSIELLFLIAKTEKYQSKIIERGSPWDLALSNVELPVWWNLKIERISPLKFRLIGDWQEFNDFLQSRRVKILSLEIKRRRRKNVAVFFNSYL